MKAKTNPTPAKLHLDRRAGKLAEEGAGHPDDLLSEKDIAEWFTVSEQWVTLSRMRGYGPPFLKVGPKMVRYRRDAVLAWLKSRTHTPKYKRTKAANIQRLAGVEA